MNLVPMPDYAIIRISKKDQTDKKESTGGLLLHPGYIWMTRNCQAGEIVAIGRNAKDHFQEAAVGDIAIVHHFVESVPESHLLFQDEEFRYYAITFHEINGKANETYGVYKTMSESIIPHPDYVFISTKDEKENTGEVTVSETGLLMFKDWKETRKDKEDKMQALAAQSQSLAKSKMTEQIKKGLQDKQNELDRISAEINSQRYESYEATFIHPSLKKSFDHNLLEGDKIFALNIAVQTKVEFMGKEYRMLNRKHIGFAIAV